MKNILAPTQNVHYNATQMSNTSRKKPSFFSELQKVSMVNNQRQSLGKETVNIPESFSLLQEITNHNPAIIAVYNIQTGIYIYVNNAVKTLLGYPKEKLLKEGFAFMASILHPEDLKRISDENEKALKTANKKSFSHKKDKIPVSFEYRVRHKNGKWIWLHTGGVVFSHDKTGKVEYVMNISVDITEQKKREAEEIKRSQLAEEENKVYYLQQINSANLRAEISDILRKESKLENVLEECLKAVVKNTKVILCNLWLVNKKEDCLEKISAAGSFPPKKTVRNRIKIGEFAVGLVAKKNKPFITNNVYRNKTLLLQSVDWAKRKKVKSFAGFPLFFKNEVIGVLAVIAPYNMTPGVHSSLANIADILAQEITRRQIETKLNESQERYLSFVKQSSEGIWRIELEQPVDTKLSVERQISKFFKFAYMAECNDAMAKMYGYKSPEQLVGARLGELLVQTDKTNIDYLTRFIESNYNLSSSESTEIDRYGNIKYFQNSLTGIVKDGKLLRAWGIQQDITERKKTEQQIIKLSKQKDEFIAIASHELKTPVTTIKAFTQILEKRFETLNDSESLLFLNKMGIQINKLTSLIADLLDISKIEAGKLQFSMTTFDLNKLVREVSDEMQRTTLKHKIIVEVDSPIIITADKDRIEQVIINLISNAIKYSPNSNRVLVKTKISDKKIKVFVQDFGIGISKEEQEKIFERFYRTENPNQQSYAGLGLGLYISAEIIRRHNGEIKVKSQKGKGSIFKFSLPIKYPIT